MKASRIREIIAEELGIALSESHNNDVSELVNMLWSMAVGDESYDEARATSIKRALINAGVTKTTAHFLVQAAEVVVDSPEGIFFDEAADKFNELADEAHQQTNS